MTFENTRARLQMEPKKIKGFRALCVVLLDEYEKVYLDATILWAMLKNHEIPNLEVKMNFFRSSPEILQIVESRFAPLRKLLEEATDGKELLDALQKNQKKPWIM